LSVLTPFTRILSLVSGSGINVTKFKQKSTFYFPTKTHTNLPEYKVISVVNVSWVNHDEKVKKLDHNKYGYLDNQIFIIKLFIKETNHTSWSC
jgi:hypothetical protein